ncbi:MAG: hypothetical protein ABI877_21000 [Gemmatimonadaceae bacterium]
MNDDEKFDNWLTSVAKDYNRPPERVPRIEMWDEIERGLAASPVHDNVRTFPVRRGLSMPAYAIAATLLLAVGVGSGYWLRGRAAPTPPSTEIGAKPTPSGSTGSYDTALQTHMANAEAFLVAYRGSSNDETDTHVRSWARDVLGTTRLMMDSPAATDAGRRRLLEELEFILVQIVQLPDSAPADERALIDRSLRRDQLLTRLRTSIPAGIVRGS